MRPHWKWAVLSPLFVATEVVAELLQPYIMSNIVNQGVLGGNSSLIVPMGIQMSVIALLGMVGGLLSIFAAGTVSYRMGADIRSALFRKTMDLSFRDMDKLRIGSLITRMTSDVQRVQGVVQASMRLLFRSPVLFVGAVSMMLMVHLGLSSVLLVLLPILFFSIIKLLKHVYPQIINIQSAMDRQNTIVQEYVSGIRVVKSHVNEEGEQERFRTNNDEVVERSLRVARWMTLLGPIMSLLLNIGIAVIVYYGARLLELGEVNVGDIMACVNYMAQILLSLLMGSHIIVSITEARASMSRVDDVLSSAEPMSAEVRDSAGDTSDMAIVFDHVSFSYDEGVGKEVLRDLCFSVKRGGTLAIVGGTGSGKSSVANLIARFYQPSAGTIWLNGQELNSYGEERLRKEVGMVMQDALLFSGTLRDNLRWGNLSATDDDLLLACEKAQIADFVRAQPEGLDYQISQKGLNLSGGQRQRFSIARAIVGDYTVLLLDDCLSAVDMRTEMLIRKELEKIEATKVVISQRMSSVRHADHILVLEQGRIIAQGTHESLYASCDLYKEMVDNQMHVE
ncbi:MAG: ABC transporter ATP-binding protein [Paludibacteraceae bacterium]|nr:ABC transporter ATP-binding protein [Paludibacteraceae bacterium]